MAALLLALADAADEGAVLRDTTGRVAKAGATDINDEAAGAAAGAATTDEGVGPRALNGKLECTTGDIRADDATDDETVRALSAGAAARILGLGLPLFWRCNAGTGGAFKLEPAGRRALIAAPPAEPESWPMELLVRGVPVDAEEEEEEKAEEDADRPAESDAKKDVDDTTGESNLKTKQIPES